jgi:hypothetical protein
MPRLKSTQIRPNPQEMSDEDFDVRWFGHTRFKYAGRAVSLLSYPIKWCYICFLVVERRIWHEITRNIAGHPLYLERFVIISHDFVAR